MTTASDIRPGWSDSYVGVPWADRGRTHEGCDCWGLVCLAYREVLGVDVESYEGSYASSLERATPARLVAAERESWEPREGEPLPLDVVLVRESPWHVGLVVGRGLMLHVRSGGEAVVQSYRGLPVEGIYRRAR